MQGKDSLAHPLFSRFTAFLQLRKMLTFYSQNRSDLCTSPYRNIVPMRRIRSLRCLDKWYKYPLFSRELWNGIINIIRILAYRKVYVRSRKPLSWIAPQGCKRTASAGYICSTCIRCRRLALYCLGYGASKRASERELSRNGIRYSLLDVHKCINNIYLITG